MLKAIKTGHEKLKADVAHWKSEVEFFPTAGNLRMLRLSVNNLQEFEEQNESRLKAIKNYPFLAK